MADNQTPEQIARDNIDKQLQHAGWDVQNKKQIDFNKGNGQAVREYQTDTGPGGYTLFVDKKSTGMIDAKTEAHIFIIISIEDHCRMKS